MEDNSRRAAALYHTKADYTLSTDPRVGCGPRKRIHFIRRMHNVVGRQSTTACNRRTAYRQTHKQVMGVASAGSTLDDTAVYLERDRERERDTRERRGGREREM